MNRSQKKTLFLLAAVVVLLVAALLVIRAVKQSAQEGQLPGGASPGGAEGLAVSVHSTHHANKNSGLQRV